MLFWFQCVSPLSNAVLPLRRVRQALHDFLVVVHFTIRGLEGRFNNGIDCILLVPLSPICGKYLLKISVRLRVLVHMIQAERDAFRVLRRVFRTRDPTAANFYICIRHLRSRVPLGRQTGIAGESLCGEIAGDRPGRAYTVWV